ncbi:hypothetical protein [Shewanella sediminis]|nr:hypothetical protein [Shewanella sediminis]
MKYKKVPHTNIEIASYLPVTAIHEQDPEKLARNILCLRRFKLLHLRGVK